MYFKSYLHYVLDQKTSAEYFKQRLARDELFQYLITVKKKKNFLSIRILSFIYF